MFRVREVCNKTAFVNENSTIKIGMNNEKGNDLKKNTKKRMDIGNVFGFNKRVKEENVSLSIMQKERKTI